MDIQTIDQQYQQLQSQSQDTIQELRTLAGKLQAAGQAGNADAKDWLLDLKSIALAIQAEQNQVSLLLQALHGFVANQGQQMMQSQPQGMPQSVPQAPWGQLPQPGYQQQPAYPSQGYQPGYAQPQGGMMGGAGGMLGSFLNSGFGRAIEMGAGFGIGNDLINQIF